MKFYAAKSSAHRAAKQAGLTKEQYEIIEQDGQFAFKQIEEAATEDLAAAAQALHDKATQPAVEADPEIAALEKQADKELEAQLNEEAAQAIEKPAKGPKPDVKHKSDIELPTKRVWHIADDMKKTNPDVRRKDVIAECVRQGVAFYTARTQYQQWLQVQKEMADREAQQAAGK